MAVSRVRPNAPLQTRITSDHQRRDAQAEQQAQDAVLYRYLFACCRSRGTSRVRKVFRPKFIRISNQPTIDHGEVELADAVRAEHARHQHREREVDQPRSRD